MSSEFVLIEEKGHTSYCDNCLKDGVTCSKLAVFAISTDRIVDIVTKKLSWTDLIPWRRTAHYHLNRLTLVVFLPIVRVRKTMKCSYRPQWGMSSLVLIRNCATGVTLVRFMIQAREVSFLDFVRNKDRRVVEPIVRLTLRFDLLADVKFVVHTLAPQK